MKINRKDEELAASFVAFAERECRPVSPLYYQLANEIAKDRDLLALALHCRARQPVPNLFLGSIHFLLLQHPHHELAGFYPSISKRNSSEIPLELVKTFCRARAAELKDILRTRIVQTNAINRTAYLMPIVSSVFEPGKPVNLVDIGSSSGLTMNLDLYAYDYGSFGQFGNSKVKINSEILAGVLPDCANMVSIKRKIGIDQNPLDLSDPNDANWLKALIWPDLQLRFARMEAAIELAKGSSLELYKAEKIRDFRLIIDQISIDEPLLVYHTHVLYQFTKKEKQAFRAMLDTVGQSRDLKYLAVESNVVFDRPDYLENGVLIELTDYKAGRKASRILGRTDGHANWIRWHPILQDEEN